MREGAWERQVPTELAMEEQQLPIDGKADTTTD
jgi:hypothetical protein